MISLLSSLFPRLIDAAAAGSCSCCCSHSYAYSYPYPCYCWHCSSTSIPPLYRLLMYGTCTLGQTPHPHPLPLLPSLPPSLPPSSLFTSALLRFLSSLPFFPSVDTSYASCTHPGIDTHLHARSALLPFPPSFPSYSSSTSLPRPSRSPGPSSSRSRCHCCCFHCSNYCRRCLLLVRRCM